MFGSLKEFIQVDVSLPQLNSKFTTQQNQEDNQYQNVPTQKRRVQSNIQEYQASDKTQLLSRFNFIKSTAKNNTKKQFNRSNYMSLSQRKPLSQHVSFFGKLEVTKDYIAKSQLKRKHNLLRAIVRTNQQQNQNEGLSDYDQSFKRLYQNFQSIYAKPILQYRNFVINQKDHQIPAHNSVQIPRKAVSTLNNRKRIQYQNCLNWAKKHKKKGQFYAQQLGKHHKQKKAETLNMGHSMINDVQKKIRALSHNSYRIQSNRTISD